MAVGDARRGESVDEQIVSLKYELEKVLRIQQNIGQNYERKKKLDLLETVEEAEFKQDLDKMKRDVAAMNRQLASLESEKARSKAINDEY